MLHAPYTLPARWQPWLLGGWAIGAGLFGLRLLIGGGMAWRMRKGRRPLDPEWADRARRLALRLGVRRAAVFVSSRVRQALVAGVWRPMVLLAAAWMSEMPPEMLEGVLAHELAHLRRLDLWAILLQRLVETFLFYHPAVWWLSRRLSREREMCCDEMAVAAIGDRLVFTQALQWAVQQPAAGSGPVLGAAWKGSRKMVLERIRRLLGADVPRERFSWWPLGLAALVAPALLMLPGLFGKDGPSAVGAAASPGGPNYVQPAELCDMSLPLGRVGDDVVLTRDLFHCIDDKMVRSYVPSEKRAALVKELTDAIRDYASHVAARDPDPAKGISEPHRVLLYKMVRRSLDVKMLYHNFLDEVPKKGQAKIQARVDRYFEDRPLKALMMRENVTTLADLENALRTKGNSLDRERKTFTEQFIAQQWILQKVKPEGGPEITPQQLDKQRQAFIKELRDEYSIWTVFDAAMKSAQAPDNRGPAKQPRPIRAGTTQPYSTAAESTHAQAGGNMFGIGASPSAGLAGSVTIDPTVPLPPRPGATVSHEGAVAYSTPITDQIAALRAEPVVFDRRKALEEMRAEVEQKRDSKDPADILRRGSYYLATEDFDRALAAFEAVMTADPNSPNAALAHCGCGKIYLLRGRDFAKAAAEFSKCLEWYEHAADESKIATIEMDWRMVYFAADWAMPIKPTDWIKRWPI